jgi:hypothetical protein
MIGRKNLVHTSGSLTSPLGVICMLLLTFPPKAVERIQGQVFAIGQGKLNTTIIEDDGPSNPK